MIRLFNLFLFLIMLFVLCPSKTSGEIFYVDNSIPDCIGKYDPESRQCNENKQTSYHSIASAVQEARDGDTIRIMPGIYQETSRISSASSVTIEGYKSEDPPVIDASAADDHIAYFFGGANPILRNLKIQSYYINNKSGMWFDSTSSVVMENIHFDNVTGDYTIRIKTAGTFKLTNISLKYSTGIKPIYHPLYIENADSGAVIERLGIFMHDYDKILLRISSLKMPKIRYSIFHGGSSAIYISPTLVIPQTESMDISNCNFSSTSSHGIIMSANASCNFIFNNCIWSMIPIKYRYNNYLISMNSQLATATLNNCVITRNIYDYSKPVVNGGTVIFNNCYEKDPRYETKEKSILIIGCDDLNNIAYFKDVIKPELDIYGWNGFMSINFPHYLSKDQINDLEAFSIDGHDIVCHSLTHCSMNNYNGITIQYIGSGSDAKVTIENTDADDFADEMRFMIDGTLDLNVDGDGIVNFDLDSKYNNLLTLCNMIDDLPDYTCSYNNVVAPGIARAMYLADATSIDIKSAPVKFDLSKERLFVGEVRDAKSILEEKTGVKVESWVSPGNTYSDDLASALMTYGFKIGRANSSPSKYTLDGINLYCIPTLNAGSFLGGNDPTTDMVKTRMAMLSAYFRPYGGVASLYAHNADEMTKEGWQRILAEAKRLGFAVMSFSQASDYIRSRNLNADSSQYFWYRCFDRTTACYGLPTYRLAEDSPCIDNGITVAGLYDSGILVTDYYGNTVSLPVDIGAVEYVKVPDFDNDGDVDGSDLAAFACELDDRNNVIQVIDFAKDFGKVYQP